MHWRTMIPLVGWLLATACSEQPSEPDDETTEQFIATLSAANVVGAEISSPGTGTALFEWNGTLLGFTITLQNMNQVIAAHIHAPASGSQNADIILNLFIPASPTGTVNGQLTVGVVVANSHLLLGTTLEALMAQMRSGQAYVLVHTTTNPDGEIRGQVQAT